MDIFETCLTVIFCVASIVTIDWLFIGILPSIKGTYPRIKTLGNDEPLINDRRCALATNLEGKDIGPRVNQRKGYFSVVLTRKHFFLKLNLLNYLFKIDVVDILKFEIEKTVLGKRMIFWFKDDKEVKYIKLDAINLSLWVDCFKDLGVEQTGRLDLI